MKVRLTDILREDANALRFQAQRCDETKTYSAFDGSVSKTVWKYLDRATGVDIAADDIAELCPDATVDLPVSAKQYILAQRVCGDIIDRKERTSADADYYYPHLTYEGWIDEVEGYMCFYNTPEDSARTGIDWEDEDVSSSDVVRLVASWLYEAYHEGDEP